MAKILVKRPGKPPEVVTVGDDQDTLHKAISDGVGGWLQHVDIVANGVQFDCWMDEEGKLKKLETNLRVPGDVFVGTLVMTGTNRSTGGTLGLNPKQLEAAMAFATGKALSVRWSG